MAGSYVLERQSYHMGKGIPVSKLDSASEFSVLKQKFSQDALDGEFDTDLRVILDAVLKERNHGHPYLMYGDALEAMRRALSKVVVGV